jgi:hypothetical protein
LVPKKSQLSNSTLGFPASSLEVRWFGGRVRELSRFKSSMKHSRSYLQVVVVILQKSRQALVVIDGHLVAMSALAQ